MKSIKNYIIILFLFIDYYSYSQVNKINLVWEGGAEFKKPRITITFQKSENEDCRLYLIEEQVCYLCANFENKIKKQEKKYIKCEDFDNLVNAIKTLNIGKLQLNNNIDYYLWFPPTMKIELYENDINVFSIKYVSPQTIDNFPISLYPLDKIAKDIFKLAGISKKYCCRFNSFSQTEKTDSADYSNIRGPDVRAYLIVTNGFCFRPKSEEYNIPFRKRKENCWNCKHINYLDGLEVSDEILNNLDLSLKSNRDVIDSLTCYSFKYRNDDTKNCIETYYYYVTLKIPIILNGVKLNPEDKETILSAIKMDEIHEVKTKRNFWGKALAVEITTVEKIQNKVSCNSRRKIKKNGANIWTNADTQ